MSPPILEGITFEVEPGETVAIVGRSGSGKTTLIKCLAGLLEPTEGSILYDGLDMRTLRYRDLRRQVGFVLQESYLFDDSIARNIAFGEDKPDIEQRASGRPKAGGRARVRRAAAARLRDARRRDGMRCPAASSSASRSRAPLYRRPPVLIFDEATSSLDTESERALKENLDKLIEGRTSFVIAHRLSTIRDADRILVLDKGKLVEQGTTTR